MKLDEELSDFKYSILMDLLSMKVNVEIINYLSDYVFPIGYNKREEIQKFTTTMILSCENIAFEGIGENGKRLVYIFENNWGLKQENNIVEIILFAGLQKIIITLPDDDYASSLFDVLNLGTQGFTTEEISQKLIVDDCMIN